MQGIAVPLILFDAPFNKLRSILVTNGVLYHLSDDVLNFNLNISAHLLWLHYIY